MASGQIVDHYTPIKKPSTFVFNSNPNWLDNYIENNTNPNPIKGIKILCNIIYGFINKNIFVKSIDSIEN